MPDYFEGDTRTRLQRLDMLHKSMLSERSTFDAHYRELGDFYLPRRTRFWVSDRNKGDRRSQKILDSTGRFAARTLQSGLHAGLTSPARPWFRLTTPDTDLARQPAVKEWLHLVTSRMLSVFLQTNLYNALPLVYGDMGVFATGAMALLEDTRDLFRCYPYPIGSYTLGLNERNVVQSFGRAYELTVRQTIGTFALKDDKRTIDWSLVSDTVKRLWERGDYEKPVEIMWMVTPNEQANPARLEAKYYPFASCHWEKAGDGKTALRESGFKTFPVFAPRWDITGEDSYGTDCPGMTALGDVKQLQIMQRRKGQAIHKMIDPPLMGPTALKSQKTSLLPGDITYVDVNQGMQGLRSIHDVTLNIEHLKQDIGETQWRIDRAFYADLFLMMAQSDQRRGQQPVTAREIDERHEEKLLALGPVLERLNDELLEPMIDRVYVLMESAGMIPEPPDELVGVSLKAEYTSIMAQAQKIIGVITMDRFLMSIGPVVQADPALRHKVNGQQVIDDYAELLGVNPKLVRPNDEADDLAAQEAQAAKAAQDAQAAATMAGAMKDAAAAPMEGDTALTRMLGQGGGGMPQPGGVM